VSSRRLLSNPIKWYPKVRCRVHKSAPLVSVVSQMNRVDKIMFYSEARGSVVVEALYYKPEGRGFETRRDECIFFSIYVILTAALGPWVYSVSNRNVYQKQKNVSGEYSAVCA
jgi:hypothetical protein